MRKAISLVVNPAEGMGGSADLKGTGGAIREEASESGVKLVTPNRPRDCLSIQSLGMLAT